MNQELLQLIQDNKETYDAYIGVNARLNKDADNIKPLIEAYESENNTKEVSGSNCQDCIIDMLRWAVKQIAPKQPSKAKAKTND